MHFVAKKNYQNRQPIEITKSEYRISEQAGNENEKTPKTEVRLMIYHICSLVELWFFAISVNSVFSLYLDNLSLISFYGPLPWAFHGYAWMTMDSMDIHGIDGCMSMESMDIHGIL